VAGLRGLSGRVALVTGGGGGFGRAICERLRSEGCVVVSADVKAEPEVDVELDVRDPDAWSSALSHVVSAHSGLDILVNNAGVAGSSSYSWELPLEEWALVLDIDLSGVYYGCRTVLPHMLDRGYGRIVNMSSVAGKDGNPRAAPYAAAKAGVIGLTKSIAREVCTRGVLVNCVTPAAFDTEILQQVDDEFRERIRGLIPMGRLGRPEELAALVAWLCSEECSFSTGAAFDISGGRSSY
jgi:3-oxoacyl-[acyl-carrier protein] reductase